MQIRSFRGVEDVAPYNDCTLPFRKIKLTDKSKFETLKS